MECVPSSRPTYPQRCGESLILPRPEFVGRCLVFIPRIRRGGRGDPRAPRLTVFRRFGFVRLVPMLVFFGAMCRCGVRTNDVPVPRRARGCFRAATYANATARAKKEKRDVVVLVHGSDWCRIGEAFRRNVWEKKEFTRRLGNGFVLFDVDVLEHPTDKEKKTQDGRQKGFGAQFGNYPVLVFVDPVGKRYAAISGHATMDRAGFPDNLSQAVRTITGLRRAREIRDYYLARAGKAGASDKPILLFRAWQAGAGRHEEILDRLRKADPDNESGFLARLDFDGCVVLEKAKSFGDSKKYRDGVHWIEEQMARNGVTTDQKQWMLTALGNLYRRWPGHEQQAWATFMQSVQIDPDSMMGRAARRLGLRFVGPPSLEFGWFPRHCKTSPTRWRIDVGRAMTSAGEYRVVLSRNKGRSALAVSSVAVFDGDRKIAESAKSAKIGPGTSRAEFALHVPRGMDHAELQIACQSISGTDSTGSVGIEYGSREQPKSTGVSAKKSGSRH